MDIDTFIDLLQKLQKKNPGAKIYLRDKTYQGSLDNTDDRWDIMIPDNPYISKNKQIVIPFN